VNDGGQNLKGDAIAQQVTDLFHMVIPIQLLKKV
jgi:hypothetical protein